MQEIKVRRVLIVDDDELVLEVVRERLESAGFEVFTHNQPIGTGSIILGSRPELILLDISMPGLSGVHLARLPVLRNIPIIFHSSKEPSELALLAKSAKALGFIKKTSNHAQFMAELRILLRKL